MDKIDVLKNTIPIGKENAIHQKELSEKLGVKPAMVKRMVQDARRVGVGICSGTEGYWFAKDDIEKQAFIRLLRKQAVARLTTVKPINDTLNTIKGQKEFNTVLNDKEVLSNGKKEKD